MEQKNTKNDLFLLTIVGIVAIVAIVIMIASSGSRTYNLSEDSAGEASRVAAVKSVSEEIATEAANISANTTKTCKDSDGGKNYYVKGTVIDGRGQKSDFCRNMTGPVLVEYYCNRDSMASVDYSCPNGCLDGACSNQTLPMCGNGIIEPGEQCEIGQTTQCSTFGNYTNGTATCNNNCYWTLTECYAPCTDSDNGLNYTIKGTAKGLISWFPYTYYEWMDYCETAMNNDTVVENYCSNDRIYQIAQSCNGYGCANGACLQGAIMNATVTLRVNGLINPNPVNYNSTFNVSWTSTGTTFCSASGAFVPLFYGGLWTDLSSVSTSGNTLVIARHATLGYISPLTLTMQCYKTDGTYVSSTVNVLVNPPNQQSSCTDSDGGINYYTYGVVTWTNGSYSYNYTDFCTNSVRLQEKYCQGIIIGNSFYDCPQGCSAGKCNNQTNSSLKPDLIVEDILITDLNNSNLTNNISGIYAMYLTPRIKNIGTASVNAYLFHNRIAVTSTSGTTGIVYVRCSNTNYTINPGVSYNCQKYMINNLGNGTTKVNITADHYNVVNELNEYNNGRVEYIYYGS